MLIKNHRIASRGSSDNGEENFKREDRYGWVSKAEIYFVVQGTPPNLQIQFTQICMEGMPRHWFKMLKEEDPNLDWERFKHAFFDRDGNQ